MQASFWMPNHKVMVHREKGTYLTGILNRKSGKTSHSSSTLFGCFQKNSISQSQNISQYDLLKYRSWFPILRVLIWSRLFPSSPKQFDKVLRSTVQNCT